MSTRAAHAFEGTNMTEPNHNGLPEGLFRRALDTVSEGSLITDAEQRIVYANASIQNFTGYSEADLLGENCRILQGVGTNPDTVHAIRESLAFGDTFTGDILNYRKDGAPFWNSLTISPVKDHTGTTTHFVSAQNDVSLLTNLQAQLLFQATHDPMTGLYNRLELDSRLTDAMARSHRRGTALAIAVIDLDDFTRINEVHGHSAGDDVLRIFGHRLAESTREDDYVARTGGDEFFLLVEGLDAEHPLRGLRSALARFEATLTKPIELDADVIVQVSMSMGIAVTLGHAVDPRMLLRIADEALYSVKARRATRDQWWEIGGVDRAGDSSTDA